MATVADVKRIARAVTKKATAGKLDSLTFNSPASDNANPSTSAQIKAALDGKQDALTFNAPSSDNANPSTSAQIKSALDGKQDTITGAATTIVSSNLQTDSVVVTSGTGKISSLMGVSTTEVGYLENVSSDIQTQLNGKQATIAASNRLNANLIANGAVGNTQFQYLFNCTGNIQGQLDDTIHEPSSFPVGDSNDYLLLMNATTKATSLATGTVSLSNNLDMNGNDIEDVDNIAIGTATPSEPLHLQGTMLQEPSGGGQGVKLFSENAGGNNHRWTVQPYAGGCNCYYTLLEVDMYHERIKGFKKMYAPQFQTYSDDRLKHNEKPIEDALSVIEQLNPIIYYKSNDMYDANFTLDASSSNLNPLDKVVTEAGFIAQEVKGIHELEFTVDGGDHNRMNDETKQHEFIEEEYTLNYNAIFTYNVKATQELLAQVKALESMVQELSARIAAIEAQV